MSATDDWESTCVIYQDFESLTTLDSTGKLVRGSIRVSISTQDLWFSRPISAAAVLQKNRYRFWKLSDGFEFRFQLVVVTKLDADEYNAVQLTWSNDLLGEEEDKRLFYPPSFPPREPWLTWLQSRLDEILVKEAASAFSLILFLQENIWDFFQPVDDNRIILFNAGDTLSSRCYDLPNILVNPKLPFKTDLPQLTNEFNTPEQQEALRTELTSTLVRWKEWLPFMCPICFESLRGSDGCYLSPCNHAFCRDCLTTYLRMKASEIGMHFRFNPFTCPVPQCRRGIRIISCVKHYLTPSLMDKVRTWYRELKNPPCYSLPQCLRRKCNGVMRKRTIDGSLIYCEVCSSEWCERCVRRVDTGTEQDAHELQCPMEDCLLFCERYLAARPAKKAQCEEKFPWIKAYAQTRVHDIALVRWIQENSGQVCPGCHTGVERSEGCFHMSCSCGTHFCYECGEEIFPPFYGTHHCWEQNRDEDEGINEPNFFQDFE